MPACSVSSFSSCDVNAVPLSVMMCDGTYACCVNICISASIIDCVSGFLIGTANRYLEKTSHAVSTCVYPFDVGSCPMRSISMMSSGPSHGSYIFSRGGRIFSFEHGRVLIHGWQLSMNVCT